jgi:integrase
VLDPAREKYAQADEWVYENAEPSQFLSPVQMQAWEKLSSPNLIRLSDALKLYLKHHKRGGDTGFASKVGRDWNSLIAVTGDVQFAELSRKHANDFVEFLGAKGQKTGTIRKSLNIVRAITASAITELELTKPNPFKALKIQGEGNDAEKAPVASSAQLQEIAETLKADVSPVALLILLQMELGTRIGEIAGLGLDDVFLDSPIPYVYFRQKPWRTLKTRDSERKVPVTGLALEALRVAVTLPRTNGGLFSAYAKARGNDNASAAVNKRLARWGLTTHSFRHTMTDRLRDAGCPKDIRDAIQGHARADIAETYGQGHSLQMMLHYLSKVAINLKAN